MSDETPGAAQGALPPREGVSTPRTMAERPAMRLTQVGTGQYVLTSQAHGIPALAQLSPGPIHANSSVLQGTRIISISPSRIAQTSPLRPSVANQSIVNVLTKPRVVNSNVRLQLFQNMEQSNVQQPPQPPAKSPSKRVYPATEKKDTFAAKLQRVMNHHIVRSKLVKEKYSEHLLEKYFAESGGNILDLYQFAKRPKTAHYVAYLKEHAIDPKEYADEAPSATIQPTPSATPVTSLPGISHSQQHTNTLTTTPTISTSSEETINTSKVPVKIKTSLNQGNQEQIVEKAKQEAYIVQKISDLQKDGLWSEKRLPKLQEMARPKAHWDFLLEEMVWLAADFAQERKWKKAAAKKCAKMVQKYFQDKALAAQRAEKAQEQHLRRVAAFCAKEIKNFWNNVEKLVEYKQNTILEEKRKRALDQQLSFIVDQTEKYSQLLAEGMNRSTNDSQSETKSRHNSDDEFHPDSQTSTDDEETIEQEEAVIDNASQNEEIAALQRESEMDFDDFLKELPKDYLQNRDQIKLSDDDENMSDDENVDSASKSDRESKDDDFSIGAHSEEDDEDTIQEQERAEGKQNHVEELKDLERENLMSVEELKKKYGNLPPAPPDEDEDISEVSEEEKGETSESDLSSSEEEEEEEDEEEEEGEKSTQPSLKLLLDDSHNEGDISKTDQDNDLINDAAAIAESIQPTGNTLSSTSVSTIIPFLLKLQLREYQHIGLDWLVTMFERKLNGILADEMGLGKTIQTIALLAHLACEKENWGPHLIVVPTSVMLNWEMECKKWCPAFKILTYYGSQKERKLKRMGWTKPNAFHICITSYKLVIQDHQSFRRKKWKYLILDEAQNIKNFKSQRWQLLLNFQTHQRLLLTGTPLQNNLMELWSLMHFLMPNVFQSHREFKEWFSNPVTGMIEGNSEYNENIIKRLHKVLRPFLLRRLKCEVEKQMPKKYEHVVMCRLSKRQRFLYDDYMSRAKTRETLESGNLLSVINVLMQLRKVCNHPNLFEVRPTISPFQCEGINYHIPSLIYAALDYDVWKHVSLPALNLNIIMMEIRLSAYQSYRIQKLKTPESLITSNTKPEEIPQVPLNTISMRVLTNDDSETLKEEATEEDENVDAQNESSDKSNTVVQKEVVENSIDSTKKTVDDNKPVNNSQFVPLGTKLTLVPNAVASEAGNAQPQKPLVKFHLPSIPPTTTNTNMSVNASAANKTQAFNVTSKFLDQLYANQSNNNLDVRWESSNPSTSETKKISEREKYEKDELDRRLRLMGKINEIRCSATPLYGKDLHNSLLVTVPSKYSTWANGYLHCTNVKKESNVEIISECLKNAVYTPAERITELSEITRRFVFYVPSVKSSEPQLQVWHPPPSIYYHEAQTKTTIANIFSSPTTPLHELASAMTTQFPDPRLIQYDCGKLQTLDKLLRELKSGSHRVLIFTQMTKMLDVLEAFLNFHGHIYLRLDGTTKVDQRQVLMERFNGDKRIFAFILSTRSGGVGVNLTGADTVIFYDSDWNPTMDAQAQDRCHRIGQTRDVHIYRLVSERTIEENILKKANQKRLLGDLAIEGGNFTTAFFKSSTIQDLFNIDSTEQSAANRMSEVVAASQEREKSRLEETEAQLSNDDKAAIGAFENALAACEDDQDVQAAKTAKAEAVADLAEFDENIPLEDADKEKEPEMSKAEQEIDNVIKKLTPVERYAMNFIEASESVWSVEHLKAAERLIEEQKREWEKNRLAAMKEEEERLAREMDEESEVLTFSREDSTNQVWISENTMEQMPVWCPPTPPQQEADVYIDNAMSFLYETKVMSETELPPIYIKKDLKRRLEGDVVDGRRVFKIARKEDTINVPRSIFQCQSQLKVKKDQKFHKYRGLMKPVITIAGKPAVVKPVVEQPVWHEWTIHEDMAVLRVLQTFQGFPLSLTVVSPALTPNWDFVADYVNAISITYRSPKQCRHRFETVLTQREEGKQIFDNNVLRKKKNKSPSQKIGFQPKVNRTLRTAHLYAQDNNQTFTQTMNHRFDTLKAIASKKAPPARPPTNNSVQKNPKHTAVLSELGIDLDHPVLPVDVAARRAERIAREKKMTPEQQAAATARAHIMKGMVNQTTASTVTTSQVSTTTTVVVASVAGSQVSTTQTPVVSSLTTTSVTTPSSAPPNTVRGQRIIASPIQTSSVVSVSSLSPAQLQAATTQRLIVSGATQGQPKAVISAQGIQSKTISTAQFQMIQQAATLKQQQLRLQQQGVKTTTVTIGGQQAVVQFTQAQPRAQFIRQGTVTVGGKAAMTRTVTESEVTQILKKQQQLQQQKALVAVGSSQASTLQSLPSQVLAQAIQQAGSSGNQVTTIVKTVSSAGATTNLKIPVSGVAIATQGKGTTIKQPNAQQLRQLQLQQLAQKKLAAQKVSIAQVGGKGNVQTQLIVGSKPLTTAMTVQQFQQVIRSPLGVTQTPLVLANRTSRVIPVNTGQGTKQTIQVVSASSQLTTALRPQGSHAGQNIKIQSSNQVQAQQALLSQVSAALQSQAGGMRQASPVRIQTASGTPIVAVTVQSASNIHNITSQAANLDQVNRFVKK